MIFQKHNQYNCLYLFHCSSYPLFKVMNSQLSLNFPALLIFNLTTLNLLEQLQNCLHFLRNIMWIILWILENYLN